MRGSPRPSTPGPVAAPPEDDAPGPARPDGSGRAVAGMAAAALVLVAALAGVEFAVEDVPWVEHTSPDEVVHDADVLDDGSVPLARVLPGHREDGREVPPRIVVYRRPLEIRAHDRDDLAELVRDVVVDQVAVLLGRDPEEIDPTS